METPVSPAPYEGIIVSTGHLLSPEQVIEARSCFRSNSDRQAPQVYWVLLRPLAASRTGLGRLSAPVDIATAVNVEPLLRAAVALGGLGIVRNHSRSMLPESPPKGLLPMAMGKEPRLFSPIQLQERGHGHDFTP
jgi:hypothetical protein